MMLQNESGPDSAAVPPWPRLCGSPTATRNSCCELNQRNHDGEQTFMVDCVSEAWPKAAGASAHITPHGTFVFT